MKQHLITAVVSALAATAIAGGVAYATIPDATGVIHGCYRTDLTDQKGQLRVVDDPANCRSNETATQWNQQGVPGAPGSQGPKGDKGDKGAAGVDGTDGTDGTNGTNGRDGSSVTSSVEPAGGNCAGGGSRFTSVTGTTYACNGRNGTDGQEGPKGDAGGLTGYEQVAESMTLNPANGPGVYGLIAHCPAGKVPVGGGFFGHGVMIIRIENSYPVSSGWLANVSVSFDQQGPYSLQVWAACANTA